MNESVIYHNGRRAHNTAHGNLCGIVNVVHILVIVTHFKMPDAVRGFRDKRFPELINYVAEKTRLYWSNFSDIEIRSTVH